MAPSSDATPLRFHIPAADYRRAVTASPTSSAAFWKYSLYKDSEGNAPTRHYCTNYEQTEAQAAKFKDEKVLGFDIEWEIGSHPGKSPAKRCVSLIQIAAEDKIGLFQIALFKGSTLDELMPPSLRHLLESPDVIKTGVNIGGDATRIERCLGVKMQGLMELSHLYKLVMFSEHQPHRVNKGLAKIADQVQNILLLPLAKGEVRVSAWSKRLDNQQTEYAASDAYAGFMLYHTLETKRKAMSPMPPRPAFWELKQPIELSDGRVVVPRSQAAKRAKDAEAKLAEDDEDHDEFFDTVEDQDAYEMAPEVAGVPLSGLQVLYPTLPPIEDLEISNPAIAQPGSPLESQQSSETANHSPAASSKFSSIEFDQADTWAASYRQEITAKGRSSAAGQAVLRAYHLWHHQGFDLKKTAALLREPPLLSTTVATYVLEAVMKEKLEYEANRMRDVVKYMPKEVRWRYADVVGKIENA